MAKGRSHGRSHRSHGHGFGHHHSTGFHHIHHSHHHHRHHGRGFGGYAVDYDQIIALNVPPIILDGAYSYTGNQMSTISQIENFQSFCQQQAATNGGQPVQINQINLLVVGNKTYEGNGCCYLTTFCLSFLIIPIIFCFMNWWKKMVQTHYQINIQTYEAIGRFLNSVPTVNNFNLTIVDNSFNAEKATVLYNYLNGKSLIGFTLTNKAGAFDYQNNQYSDFAANTMNIKSLPFQSTLTWDSTIL